MYFICSRCYSVIIFALFCNRNIILLKVKLISFFTLAMQKVQVGTGNEFRDCHPVVTSLLNRFKVCGTVSVSADQQYVDITCEESGHYLALQANHSFSLNEVQVRGKKLINAGLLDVSQTSCSPYDSKCCS